MVTDRLDFDCVQICSFNFVTMLHTGDVEAISSEENEGGVESVFVGKITQSGIRIQGLGSTVDYLWQEKMRTVKHTLCHCYWKLELLFTFELHACTY